MPCLAYAMATAMKLLVMLATYKVPFRVSSTWTRDYPHRAPLRARGDYRAVARRALRSWWKSCRCSFESFSGMCT